MASLPISITSLKIFLDITHS
ncbi:CRISPR-associated DxTHG motif protein [Rossellomorea vietnamensis]|uniref:CRISPR-associated DxTHG motif protein n=1 Tax=Rossellomorea vietnamensis TaxID=218284 RepID=A0A5D4MG76_9BACI|nr:CRISPR-associated DxTHG motif protein [Rossellomorea vietnamensis]